MRPRSDRPSSSLVPSPLGCVPGRPLDDQIVDGAQLDLVGHPNSSFVSALSHSHSRTPARGGIIPTGRTRLAVNGKDADQRRGYARCPCRASPPSTRSSRARSLARPFTYEVPDEVGRALSSRFASATRGGAASSSTSTSRRRTGVEPPPIERVLETLPPALVDLALWLADYYGSTPARALALVAPHNPARRGERRESPPGRAARRPSRRPPISPSAGTRARADRGAARRGRRQRPARRRDRQRQDRGLHPRLRGGARARARRDRARPRDRAHAADARPLPRALRRPRRAAPLGLPRPSGATSGSGSRRARRRSSSAPARLSSRRSRRSA